MEKNIVAKVSVRPEFRTEFLELTKELIASTRKEEGNIFYDLYEDVNTPSEFLFCEKYKDQAAIDFHSKSDHFIRFASGIEKMLNKELEIQVF